MKLLPVIRRRAPALAALVAIGLLAGCESLPRLGGAAPETVVDEATRAFAARRTALLAVTDFTLNARLAVAATDQGGSAKVRWQDVEGRYRVAIDPPLGGTALLLLERDDGVELLTADGYRELSPSAEALVEKHLGFSVPVSGARYWLRGIPDPNRDEGQLTLDEFGRMTDLEQDRWRISVLDYVTVADLDLPRRLFLQRDDVKVRFVVDEWNLDR